MRAWIIILVLLAAVTLAHGQGSKTPINNGVLQSDLNAAGYKILGANMANYAGLNMTWNTVTGRFDAAGGGGGSGTVTSITATAPIVVTPSPIVNTGVISISSIPNGSLANSSMTIATNSVSLGGTVTQDQITGLASTGIVKRTAANTLAVAVAGTDYAAPDSPLQWDGGATNLVAATGRTSLALNNVTNNAQTQAAIVPNTAPTAGQILAGNAGGTAYAPATVSGSGATISLASTGVMTISSIAPASINAAAGVATWMTTPTSANLSTALTDETGTGGAAVFASSPTITTPSFTTGFTIGGAAASGKIIVGNGTNYVASTPTYPNAASPTALKWMRADGTNWIASTSTLAEGAVTAGKILQSDATNWTASTPVFPTTVGTAGYGVTSNGSTGYAAYPTQLVSSSTATVSAGYAADTYLAGSAITVAAGDFKVSGQYHCVFDMTKTGAGTATPIITVRAGTAGTTADAAICTLTFSAGTAVIDSGMFEVYVVFRTVGSGTSAVFQAIGTLQHQGGVTGLVSKNSDYASSTSSGFASTTQTKLGLSFNGGTSFAGTNLLVQSQLEQP